MADWYSNPTLMGGKPLKRSWLWTLLAFGIIAVKFGFWAWVFIAKLFL